MGGVVDSSIELRRILLLTLLRDAGKGLTMQQLVGECGSVPGWNVTGTTRWDVVRLVLQSLIDEGLVAVEGRVVLTTRGAEEFEKPLKVRSCWGAIKEVEWQVVLGSVYEKSVYERSRLEP